MKRQLNLISMAILFAAAAAFSDSSDSIAVNTPYNPATGIWIQQVGDLYPSASTADTVYYTRYNEQLSAKALDYYYDGNGYLKLSNKRLLCRTPGADGIVEHPDGDLLVAGQENNAVYKVDKSASDTSASKCIVKTSNAKARSATYHLMVNPDNSVLWSAGIPGNLVSYAIDSTADKRLEQIRQVKISGSISNITTIVWDSSGQAFYTRSSNLGTISKYSSSNAQFGIIVDTTCAVNENPCQAKNITGLKTKTLIDSLKGAHGASYDEYSNTILLFGDSHIVQIDPSTRKVVADVDLRKYMFPDSLMTGSYSSNGAETNGYAIKNSTEIRWLLDQGTADHKGHIFVASNSGHLIFLDYTSNVNKRIDNNILIHVQWIDNYLDDLAPIAGAGSNRAQANTNSGTLVSSNSRSSSSVSIFHESSSSAASSSSATGGGSSKSSSSGKGSSSSALGSSGSGNSSGSTGGSSGSVNSSGSTGGSSGSGNSSGSTGGSSGSVNSSGSTGGSSGGGNSSGSTGGSSGSTGNGDEGASSSSGSGSTGSGNEWIPPWVSDSTVYEGFDDEGQENQNGVDVYPTNDKRDKGDTLVTEGSKLIPVTSDSATGNTIVINGNTYVTNGGSASTTLPSYGSDSVSSTGRENVYVGDVVSITLDADKLRDYFGDVDTIYVSGSEGLLFTDPENPSDPSANLAVAVTGKDLSVWVTANSEVFVGSIYFTDKDGHLIIFDGINFYDPIPKAETSYIQDADDDGLLDSIEVILADTIPAGISATGLAVVVNGDTLELNSPLTVVGSRIYASAAELGLSADSFPENARVIVTYTSDETGAVYSRDAELLRLGSHVIKQAYAIRSANGRDSLFIEFNIDIIPADLSSPEMIVWLNGLGFDLDQVSVHLPTKNTLILVGDSLALNGSTDYVTLAPGASFENLSFIATAEYERRVPVTVVDRYPSANLVEYYDVDGDGSMDSVVVRFSSKVTAADIENFYFSFPWYSSRGLLIELQALPRDLVLSEDGMSVGWRVRSNVNVASGLTSIGMDIPAATLYTYYDIFGNTFVSSQTVAIADKMAPVIVAASLHYGESDKRDTLTVTFSEPVDYSSLSGKDFFAYIHGKDTIDLNPSKMLWNADGKSVRLVLVESTDGIVPGDSLIVVRGKKSAIADTYGNESVENASPVVIGGLLGKMVESVKMGFYDPEKYVSSTLNSVSISYVSNQTRTSDLRDEGTLGHLISLGERFVPQLIDGAKLDADGNYDPAVLDSINPEDVFVNFSVSYFDNLGQYVTDTTFNIPCNSPAFGASQNCLTTDKKVFVNWNYKDHTGRLVGSGIYIVEFKLVVRYKQKKVQEEMRDKWGVRRKKAK